MLLMDGFMGLAMGEAMLIDRLKFVSYDAFSMSFFLSMLEEGRGWSLEWP